MRSLTKHITRSAGRGLLAATLCYAVAGCGGSATGTDASRTADMSSSKDMAPNWNVDLGVVSFQQIETQVFVAHCGSGSRMGLNCHEKGSRDEANMDLSVGAAYMNLVNHPAYANPNLMRVKPGEPLNSFIWDKLNDILTPTEGNPMPFQSGGAFMPISVELRQMIYQWILQGAQNN